ncbi:MAG: ROK family protein [Candidatus Sumerlaeia bacterium]|nr:ROK family protein [Candidatus Sumerlaeia bacterium]
MSEQTILIGIDGGATEAKSHEVLVTGRGKRARFTLGERSASRRYERVEGFTPVPVSEQIKQRSEGNVQLTDAERAQGAKYTDAAAATVIEIARAAGASRVVVGMGMPGLKTDDGRGINAINNGARTPGFVAQLERKITEAGITMAAPIARLGSDADYCGIGEEFAADGAFRRVKSAYYVGCGTGIADALKIDGALVRFDETKDWLQKSWQIASWLGPTFEKIASSGALMTLYSGLRKTTPAQLVDQGDFPQDLAVAGDPLAKAVMAAVAATLAEIVFERLFTVHAGREEAPHRGDAYLALRRDHPHRGKLLERVVIGQRFGFLWADAKYAKVFRRPAEENLVALALRCPEPAVRDHIAPGGKINRKLLVASKLREAPAIGAAIDAWQTLQ